MSSNVHTVEEMKRYKKLQENPDFELIKKYCDAVCIKAIQNHDEKVKEKVRHEIADGINEIFSKGFFFLMYKFSEYKKEIKNGCTDSDVRNNN